MKKTALIILLCALSMTGMRASEYNYLVFTLNSGETKAITASNMTISFADGSLIAKSGSETLATLTLTDIYAMEFSNNVSTGIEDISVNQLITDAGTTIYDMNGRQMPKDVPLPKGVYIIKNSSKTIKMHIR